MINYTVTVLCNLQLTPLCKLLTGCVVLSHSDKQEKGILSVPQWTISEEVQMEGEAHCNAVTLVPDDQIFLFSPFLGQSEVQCNILAGGALCRGIFGHGNRINPRQSLIKSVTTSTTFSQSRNSLGGQSTWSNTINWETSFYAASIKIMGCHLSHSKWTKI